MREMCSELQGLRSCCRCTHFETAGTGKLKRRRSAAQATPVKVKRRIAHERGLTVELKVVFAFQNVVENAEAAADAGLATSGGSQANPKRGAKFFLSGKFVPLGAPGSPGNTNPTGAFTNRCDCSSWNHGKRAPLSIRLGRVVFVAQAQR